MKLSTLCLVASLSLGLAGQAFGQTSADAYRKAGEAYFKAGQFRESVKAYQQVIRLEPNDAGAYQQLGEAFNRLNMSKEAAEAFEKSADLLTSGVGKPVSFPVPASAASASQSTAGKTMPLDEIARRMIRKQFQGRSSLPERVTFASVQVNPQGTDNFVVNAKFTVRGYYSDSTTAYDYDQRFLLFKKAGSWGILQDTGSASNYRSEPKQAPPPPGDTDVPVTAAAAAQPDRSTPAAANGGDGAVPLGQYNCVMYAGGQLIHVGGFTLLSGGVYHDEDNGRGTFAYDPSQHQISFQGAAMGGQLGRYDSAGGKFTLKSEHNSVDCDRGR
jgi:hypothetical protein